MNFRIHAHLNLTPLHFFSRRAELVDYEEEEEAPAADEKAAGDENVKKCVRERACAAALRAAAAEAPRGCCRCRRRQRRPPRDARAARSQPRAGPKKKKKSARARLPANFLPLARWLEGGRRDAVRHSLPPIALCLARCDPSRPADRPLTVPDCVRSTPPASRARARTPAHPLFFFFLSAACPARRCVRSYTPSTREQGVRGHPLVRLP